MQIGSCRLTAGECVCVVKRVIYMENCTTESHPSFHIQLVPHTTLSQTFTNNVQFCNRIRNEPMSFKVNTSEFYDDGKWNPGLRIISPSFSQYKWRTHYSFVRLLHAHYTHYNMTQFSIELGIYLNSKEYSLQCDEEIRSERSEISVREFFEFYFFLLLQ